jgi:predicted nucleotidyltransferase component of viral defense system
MARKFLHQDSEFRNLIQITADELALNPYMVEKDYWIMHCLWGLQNQSFNFELKGGTSLSKGYKVIHRFSEDIDLRIMDISGGSV